MRLETRAAPVTYLLHLDHDSLGFADDDRGRGLGRGRQRRGGLGRRRRPDLHLLLLPIVAVEVARQLGVHVTHVDHRHHRLLIRTEQAQLTVDSNQLSPWLKYGMSVKSLGVLFVRAL